MEEVDNEVDLIREYSSESSYDSGPTESTNSESMSTQTTTPPQTFLDPNDIGPSTVYYRETSSRPDIRDLREKVKKSNINRAPPVDREKKNMGTFLGVFLPIIVSLMSMTYWVRVGKLVGDCGVVYSLLIIWVSAIVSLILITTLSALGSNGEMDRGGIYFIMSRSIGPELGRCLTLFLDVSTCLGAAGVVVGFAETIISMYEPKYFTGTQLNDIRLIAFAVMFCSIPLYRWWTYSLRITGLTHTIGLICFFIGCFSRKPGSTSGFTGPSVLTFKSNALAPMTVSKFFSYIYTVSPGFTALTGCWSYAGNLKRPMKMIPRGLLIAFGVSILIWHVTIIMLGLCADKTFLESNVASPLMSFSINKWIGFTTIIVFGIHRSHGNLGYEIDLVTTLADDKLLPKIRWHYDYVIPLTITAIFVAIGDLDFTANINTIFFLTLSVVFNWCVWSASRAHIPGWRPKAKYWSPYLSLFGAIITLIMCFMISWLNTIINWIIFGIIYWLSNHYKTDQNWGSLRQAKAFYDAYTHALGTQRISQNPKLFRINLLTVVGENEKFEETTLPFIDIVLNGEGFCIVSQVFNETNGINVALEQRVGLQKYYADAHNIFYETVMAANPIDALTRQMLTSGVGAFRPNTVFINMDGRSADEIHEMIMEILQAKYGCILATRPNEINAQSDYIDIYWLSDEGGLTVLAGYIIAKSMKKKIRIITVAYTGNGDTVEESENRTRKLCEKFRIEAEVVGRELCERKQRPSSLSTAFWENLTQRSAYDQTFTRFLLFADMIREFSSSACLVISTLFVPTDDMNAAIYTDILKLISNIPPAFAFVRGNGENVLSWKV